MKNLKFKVLFVFTFVCNILDLMKYSENWVADTIDHMPAEYFDKYYS